MSKVIEGVGPEAEIETLPGGGRQSKVPARLDRIPGRAMLALGKVLKEGAEKYGEDVPGKENWRLVGTRGNLNKSLIHIYAWLAGDRQDDHLEHALCRLMFAVDVEMDEPEPAINHPGVTEHFRLQPDVDPIPVASTAAVGRNLPSCVNWEIIYGDWYYFESPEKRAQDEYKYHIFASKGENEKGLFVCFKCSPDGCMNQVGYFKSVVTAIEAVDKLEAGK